MVGATPTSRPIAFHSKPRNAVAPGTVLTRTHPGPGGATDEVIETLRRLSAVKRLADPDEIAEAVAFLASPRSSYLTGSTVEVRGGRLPLA